MLQPLTLAPHTAEIAAGSTGQHVPLLSLHTPVGDISVAEEDGAVVSVDWGWGRDQDETVLLRRARDRLETGRPLTGTVTLLSATPEQRRAVERLTGRPARSGESLSVSLAEVDRILRDSGVAPGGLSEAVTRLSSPLRDRSRERADLAAAWSAAFAPLDEAVAGRAELAPWRGWLDATGQAGRKRKGRGHRQKDSETEALIVAIDRPGSCQVPPPQALLDRSLACRRL